MCIFPEGRRSIDEEVKDFKKGIGILIKEMDTPVIPVYIKGSHQSWPRTNRLPRPFPVKVIFGKALYVHDLLEAKKETSDQYEAIAKALRREVLKLAC